MSRTLDSPSGLTFTPTTVVASRFNASGSIELTKTPLGPMYREFYQQIVSQYLSTANDDPTNDKSGTASLFRAAVVPLTEGLRNELGQEPEYAALFFPSVFSFAERTAAVAGVLGDQFNRPIKDGPAWQATCEGYGFLQGKNLGRSPEECNDEGPQNFVIVLEYEEEYLSAWLLDVAFGLGVCYPEQNQFCKECSAKTRQIDDPETYRDRVNGFLNGFVQRVLQQHDPESIRAIIVSGEASTEASIELGETVRTAVGSKTASFMTDIDPSEVVPNGAAVWARMVQREPRLFTGDWVPHPDPDHHEL